MLPSPEPGSWPAAVTLRSAVWESEPPCSLLSAAAFWGTFFLSGDLLWLPQLGGLCRVPLPVTLPAGSAPLSAGMAGAAAQGRFTSSRALGRKTGHLALQSSKVVFFHWMCSKRYIMINLKSISFFVACARQIYNIFSFFFNSGFLVRTVIY